MVDLNVIADLVNKLTKECEESGDFINPVEVLGVLYRARLITVGEYNARLNRIERKYRWCIFCKDAKSVKPGLPHCQECSDKIRAANKSRIETSVA